jgi:hypothetical protein
MRERCVGLRIVVAVAGTAAVISVSTDRTSAQAPPNFTAAPAPAAALKTPWGEPDLQGIWTDENDTPLQRPAKYANQEFFTPAQRAQLDEARTAGQPVPPDLEFGAARRKPVEHQEKAGNRNCAALRGGAGRTRTPKQAIMGTSDELLQHLTMRAFQLTCQHDRPNLLTHAQPTEERAHVANRRIRTRTSGGVAGEGCEAAPIPIAFSALRLCPSGQRCLV